MALPRRTLTGIIALALITVTMVLASASHVLGVGDTISEALPTVALIGAHVAVMYIGVRLAQKGFVNDVKIEYAGVTLLVLLYSSMGSVALSNLGVESPTEIVPAMLAVAILYFGTVIAYGYRSRQMFSTWRAKAMLTAMSTVLLAAAGTLISVIFIGAMITFFLIMLLEVLHVIGRTKQAGEPHHLRDGGRVYTVIVGFPVTLALSVVGLFVRGNRR